MAENIFNIDTIDSYNRTLGFETRHPLVAITDLSKLTAQ